MHRLSIAILLTTLTQGLALDIKPDVIVEEHRMVHVHYDPGEDSYVSIFGTLNGDFILVEIIDLEPGHAVFIGPPAKYLVDGMEGGKRVQQLVTIKEKKEPKPPKPDPDTDEDEDDGENEDDDEDDDTQPFPETKYNVGPQVAKYFKITGKSKEVAKIFRSAALAANQNRRSVQQLITAIRPKIVNMKDPITSSSYNQYLDLIESKRKANQIVKLKDFAGAWNEIADWLEK